MRIRAAGIAAIVLWAGVAGAAAPDFEALDIQTYEPPRPAPQFALPDLDGKTVRLADAQGKVVMVFFWKTW
jgi:cytochrome oxidase Cu insertion factor (SCO1/SenC/PrrC family)